MDLDPRPGHFHQKRISNQQAEVDNWSYNCGDTGSKLPTLLKIISVD